VSLCIGVRIDISNYVQYYQGSQLIISEIPTVNACKYIFLSTVMCCTYLTQLLYITPKKNVYESKLLVNIAY